MKILIILYKKMTYSYKKISLTGKDKLMTKFRIAKKKKKTLMRSF